MLDVGNGHKLWFEQKGQGTHALVLHGGPGSGCTPVHYDLFDLTRYRVTLLDQRGCGRSTPWAGNDLAALDFNTTLYLVEDIESLRQYLNVDQWVIFGGSWGSTLAMTYAQTHPDCVRAMVLAGVATTTPRDLQWLYGDICNMFPEAYAAFCAEVPEVPTEPAATLDRISAYAHRLKDRQTAQSAADAWCAWEVGIFRGRLDDSNSRFADPGFRRASARIVTHYFSNGAWLVPDQLLSNVESIAHIPCTMIHSRFDPSCPLRAAWDLNEAWSAATLQILSGQVHSALDAEMTIAIRAATDALMN